jgi:predicted nuclease of predicted toxin-antitoxin system
MKFLVDAQIPKRIAHRLQEAGYDAIHTSDLPKQNRTSDEGINQISLLEQRIVVTKDSDFLNSFLLQQRPYKLLLITTGNISNRDLEALYMEQSGMR